MDTSFKLQNDHYIETSQLICSAFNELIMIFEVLLGGAEKLLTTEKLFQRLGNGDKWCKKALTLGIVYFLWGAQLSSRVAHT